MCASEVRTRSIGQALYMVYIYFEFEVRMCPVLKWWRALYGLNEGELCRQQLLVSGVFSRSASYLSALSSKTPLVRRALQGTTTLSQQSSPVVSRT